MIRWDVVARVVLAGGLLVAVSLFRVG